MASGDSLNILDALAMPPGANYATMDTIIGASTPTESFNVLKFGGASGAQIDYADFKIFIPRNYANGGFKLNLHAAAAGVSGPIRWEAAFRRLNDDGPDLDTSGFTYDYNGVNATSSATQGKPKYHEIPFTHGTDSDGVVGGEWAVLRIRRKTDDANDTAAFAAYLLGFELKET